MGAIVTKWLGVGLLAVAGIAFLPLYAAVASEPHLPGQADPRWLTPALALWLVGAIAGTLLAMRGERRLR